MIYPSKKLRNGGNAPYRGYPNSGQRQYPAADPLLGIGIQYQSSDDDIADVVALKELNATKMANEQKLADERAKRMPNEMAIREFVNKASGTAAGKRKMLEGLNENLTSFTDKQFADQNYIFGDAARKHLTSIYDTISPDKLQAMSDDKENLDNSIKSLIKNKSAEQYNFLNGRVSARDNQTGKIGLIDPKDLYEQVEVDGKKSNRYEPVKASELYTNIQSEGGDSSSINADMDNAAAVKDQIEQSFFTNLGSTIENSDFRDTANNFSQLRQAKAQAIAGITESQKDSLRADFLSQNKGSYTEKGFNEYLNKYLDSIAGKMRSSSSKIDKIALEQAKAAARAAAADKATGGLNGSIVDPSQGSFAARSENGMGIDGTVSVKQFGTSARELPPADKLFNIDLNEGPGAWVLGNRVGFTKDSQKDGKLVNRSDVLQGNVTGYKVIPISTGRIWKNGKVESGTSKGKIIFSDKSTSQKTGKYDGSTVDDSAMVEDNPYDDGSYAGNTKVIKRKDGSFEEVELTSVTVYSVPGENLTIIKPNNLRESLDQTNEDLSLEKSVRKFYTPSGKMTPDAKQILDEMASAPSGDQILLAFEKARASLQEPARTNYSNMVLNANYRIMLANQVRATRGLGPVSIKYSAVKPKETE